LLFFKKKVILTDIDGVMLDWEEGFSVWMEHHGYKPVDGYKLLYSIGDRYGITKDEGHKLVRLFNESAAIGFLPPVRDAQQYVRLLAEKHKYKFLAVTSLSKDVYARELRIRNLKKLFGDIFIDVICLDTGADKDEELDRLGRVYKGNYWIEDKPENADAGIRCGFKTLLVEHGHNLDYKGPATVVKTWEEIYNIITK
jgi:beta-phosphoglucomutase-like phosphatase (HAD superfamily)